MSGGAPFPAEILSAVGLLEVMGDYWRAGGFKPELHDCVAGTADGALRAVRDRLQLLDVLEDFPHGAGDPHHRDQVRYQIRHLYGAVRRWFALSYQEIPKSLL